MTGAVPATTIAVRRDSPLCGDVIDLEVTLDGDRLVSTAHRARACSLVVASARILDALAPGLALDAVLRIGRDLETALAGNGPMPDGFDAVAHVRALPSRRRCVTLPWRALADALAARPERRGRSA